MDVEYLNASTNSTYDTLSNNNYNLSLYSVSALMILITFTLLFSTISLLSENLFNNSHKQIIVKSLQNFIDYYRTLYYFLNQGSLRDCPYFKDNIQAKCHIYSLTLIFTIWDRPHYRNGTFQQDMINNLCDVAIPGTGIPLHIFAYSKILTFWLITIGYPIIAFIAAVYASKNINTFCEAFITQLIEPQDWFSFWRLNCRLATYHSGLTNYEKDYALEDKWTFLQEAEKQSVAVTPYMKFDGIVCKHRNMEGGLGFHSFNNASNGGDWIIQEKLGNAKFLQDLLPSDAPLSTFRIISASRGGLQGLTNDDKDVTMDDITALSCVWRGGRSKAKTDHTSILFNVNPKTGEMKKGTTNTHWYQRGLDKIFNTPWLSYHDVTHHPDNEVQITGKVVPNMKEMMDFVRDAHLKLIPHVPLCGWDVALTEKYGMVLLEGNFSCNFFRGDFDQQLYFKFVEDYFVALQEYDNKKMKKKEKKA